MGLRFRPLLVSWDAAGLCSQRGPVSGPADARRCCLVSSPARTIPRLWAARQGPSAILESLAGDGIGPAWYAGGDISGESRGSVNCSPAGILRSLAADARGGEDRCALSPRWFSPQWEGRGTDCFRGGRRRLRNLIAFRQPAQCTVAPRAYAGSVFGAANCALLGMS